MEKLINEFSVGLFFWQTLIFLVLLFLLRKFAWKPILNAVNDREKSIRDSLNQAEEAKREMKKLESNNKALLKEAQAERDSMMKEAKEERNAMIKEAKQKAKLEADKLVAEARTTINNEKLAAVGEIKSQVASLSVDIAEKILQKELSVEDKQKALMEKLVDDLELN